MTTLDQIDPALIGFDSVSVDDLERMQAVDRDALAFGVIGFSESNEVEIYNATESKLAGLRPDRVIGESLFISVAPCMNNFLVAQRFEDEAELDEVIDYVFTLRMRPTKIKLRMLKQSGVARRYILVVRR
jgi:photoactive yellow protein